MEKRNFRLFLFSNVISKFGDSIDLIGFMWLTYEVTGSMALTGIVAAFNGLPAIVLGLVSGIIADRFNKKKLMLFSDFFRGIMVVIICIFYILNFLNVIILITATLIISILEILSTPARRAVMPIIISKEKLLISNSKLSSGKLMAQLMGLAIAGTIISKFGVMTAMLIDAFTFFISFILLSNITFQKKEESRNSSISIKSEVKEAFLILFKEAAVFKTTITATLVNLFIGPFNLLILKYCVDVLDKGSEGQSILNTASIIGVLLVNFILCRHIKEECYEKLINLGFILICCSFIFYGLNSYLLISIVITLIYGIGTGFITSASVTLIQKDTPKEHLGKVLSIISLVNESSVPLGNFIAGILTSKISINLIFISFGLAMFLFIIILHILFLIYDKKTIKEKG